jgi:hypothetical protein
MILTPGRNLDLKSRSSELRNLGLRWFEVSDRAESRSAAGRRRILSRRILRESRGRNRSNGSSIRDFRCRRISEFGSKSENEIVQDWNFWNKPNMTYPNT